MKRSDRGYCAASHLRHAGQPTHLVSIGTDRLFGNSHTCIPSLGPLHGALSFFCQLFHGIMDHSPYKYKYIKLPNYPLFFSSFLLTSPSFVILIHVFCLFVLNIEHQAKGILMGHSLHSPTPHRLIMDEVELLSRLHVACNLYSE